MTPTLASAAGLLVLLLLGGIVFALLAGAHVFRHRTARAAMAALYILVITFSTILLVQKAAGRARLDFTAEKNYTLSPGTVRVLKSLDPPVKLRLYYSRRAALKAPDEIRVWNNYFIYVQELLEEYAKRAEGRIDLAVIDPRPYSEAEEEAVRFGIRRFPISEEESFFFGLVAVTELGRSRAIDFFSYNRQPFVEYDITKLLADVTRRDQRRVGILSPLTILGEELSPYMRQMMEMQGQNPPASWVVVSHLQESYALETVDADAAEIPPGIDFLMVVQPKNLPPKTLFAVDQFVMRGGKILVFIDPYCLADQPPREPQNPYAAMGYEPASNLEGLLKGWGVEMDPKAIAVDPDRAIKVNAPDGRKAVFPFFIDLSGDCLNRAEVATGPLNSVRMLFSGILKPVPGAETNLTPLLETGEAAGGWVPRGPYDVQMQIQQPNLQNVLASVQNAREKKILACRLTGPFKTNFPDGIELPEEGSEAEEPPPPPPPPPPTPPRPKNPKAP
ncbi:MAG: GldG family protein, partial [Planctomycetota bacterium]